LIRDESHATGTIFYQSRCRVIVNEFRSHVFD
jgi:hypothetical protein